VLQIYVSGPGRVFSRLTYSTRIGSGRNEQVAGTPDARRVPTFNGRIMVLYIPIQGGIRRAEAEFDGSFSGCTARVMAARERGVQTMVSRSLINGRPVYMQSITAGGASCSIQLGNIFGN
jgi:hypothetical protein